MPALSLLLSLVALVLAIAIASLCVLVAWARWLPRRTAAPAMVTRVAYWLLGIGLFTSFVDSSSRW